MDKVFSILGRIAFGLLVITAVGLFILSQFRIVGDFERIEFHPNLFGFPKGDY